MTREAKNPAAFMCGSPQASKKHHLFYDNDARSVCGKWLYMGETYVIDDEKYPFGSDKEDCAACAKVYRQAKEDAK